MDLQATIEAGEKVIEGAQARKKPRGAAENPERFILDQSPGAELAPRQAEFTAAMAADASKKLSEAGGEYRSLKLSELVESPTNPRKHYDQVRLLELAAEIKSSGRIYQPLLVRRNGVNHPPWEIIFGSRRFRAAKIAGLKEVPVRVMELSDDQAREAQIVENSKRDDVHPLEEGLGFEAWIKAGKIDAAGIAAKLGVSQSYVYQRLKLCELIPAAKKLFLEGEITAGHAVPIARLTSAAQELALKYCVFEVWCDELHKRMMATRSVRELNRWIANHMHLDLHSAAFKTDDANLVPSAGPCTTCPKRSGCQPQLFDDIQKKDTCTDPACFHEKQAAHARLQEVILSASKEKFVKVSDNYEALRGEKDVLTKYGWAECKPKAPGAVKALVVSGERQGRVLTVKVNAAAASRENGRNPDIDNYRKRELAEQKKRKAESERRVELLKAVIAKVNERTCDRKTFVISRDDLELVARHLHKRTSFDAQKKLAAVFALEDPKEPRDVSAKFLAKLPDVELYRFLIGAVLCNDAVVWSYHSSKPTDLLAVAARLDVKQPAAKQEPAAKTKAKLK